MRSKAKREPHFAVCIDNTGYRASLEVGKLYRVIPDENAAKHGYVRVIDESGDQYGYSAGRFFVLKVPAALAGALSAHTTLRRSRTLRPAAAPRRRLHAGRESVGRRQGLAPLILVIPCSLAPPLPPRQS